MKSDFGNGGGTGFVKDLRNVEQIVQIVGIVPHPIAVQISPAAPVVVVAQLAPVNVPVHIEEIPQACIVHGLKFFVVHGVQ